MSSNKSASGERSASVTATIVLNQPVGAICAFYGGRNDLITGWLLCDRSSFDAKAYPSLAAILGKSNTPDLRGYFVRGLDPTGQIDPEGKSRQPGSTQADAFAAHSHSFQVWKSYDSGTGYDGGGNDFGNVPADTSSVGGSETRPKNVALNYIIFAGFPPDQH